jgi:alkanesulfonate monooxygenase SsuD/methylene tetrahydromethanopterin reductase-like flavin-dependent oxidoreductase (luciferase family)
MDSRLDPQARYMLQQALACAVIGGPATVKAGLAAFIERTRADEVIVAASIFDHAARLRSFEIVAQAHETMALAA